MKRGRWRIRQPKAIHRWLRFNFVGLIGVVVQLCVLQALISAKLDYRIATLVAVEMALMNNFFWHLRFTWRERKLRSSRLVLRRLMEFHLTNGLVSLASSWSLMALLVGHALMPVIVANVICIFACSTVNFLLAEVLVFRTPQHDRVA
jgi:putative flippase GtrA